MTHGFCLSSRLAAMNVNVNVKCISPLSKTLYIEVFSSNQLEGGSVSGKVHFNVLFCHSTFSLHFYSMRIRFLVSHAHVHVHMWTQRLVFSRQNQFSNAFHSPRLKVNFDCSNWIELPRPKIHFCKGEVIFPCDVFIFIPGEGNSHTIAKEHVFDWPYPCSTDSCSLLHIWSRVLNNLMSFHCGNSHFCPASVVVGVFLPFIIPSYWKRHVCDLRGWSTVCV